MSESLAAVEAKSLTKMFGGVCAVGDVTLRVMPGEVYGLVGDEGSGRTTLLSLMAGLMMPSSGTASVFGGPKLPNSRVGSVIGPPPLDNRISARDNVLAKAIALGVANVHKRCEEVLDDVGLGRRAVRAGTLSPEERMLVGIALALVGSPDLLLLDEPLVPLGDERRGVIARLLLRLAEERAVAVIVAEGSLARVRGLADRIGFLRRGRLVRELSAEQVESASAGSLRLRTTDLPETLVTLREGIPGTAVELVDDGRGPAHLLVRNADEADVARLLAQTSAEVLELVRERRGEHVDQSHYEGRQ